MEVMVGKNAGFCYGVRNAVEKTKQELAKGKVNCLGELIHNKQVVENLEQEGLTTIENIADAKAKTIIRAHGIPKETYEVADKLGIELMDLTCPNVLKIHKLAEEYEKKGWYIVLVGLKDHPENIGTISFCGKDSCIVENIEEIQDVIQKIRDSKKEEILILSQTTFNLEKFLQIANQLKEKLEDKKVEIKNTICSSTKIRQEETKKIASQVEYMMIIGGKHSSNTKKLYEIARKHCKEVIMIETKEELDKQEIQKYQKIGIMAGASTPQESIDEVIKEIQ